jgi:peptide-methionine (S)-S-oxide reductase
MEDMIDDGSITRTPGTETAILAGGCFWGMEDLIRRQPGVLDTRLSVEGSWIWKKNARMSR